MCGISGIVSWSEVRDQRAIVGRMNKCLSHRGPDAEGYYFDNQVGLGHRRLRIIDLMGGDQPIYNEDRTIVVIFNGEIYNYLALRASLEKQGHCFKTASDTETIVHCYEEDGIDFLNRLQGIFAICLWDKNRQRLVLAVDRLGVKPLLYYENSGLVAFGSEMEALAASGVVPREVDSHAVRDYFTFGYIPGPLTIYKGVRRLMPGSVLVAERGEARVKNYWNLRPSSGQRLSFEEASHNLRMLLTKVVQRRLIADVPLGAFLSGGLDSSILVGLMAQAMSRPVKTFSIGFDGAGLLDETKYAAKVAAFNGTDHHVYQIRHQDVLEILPRALSGLGEPFADYAYLPTYTLSEMAKQEVTVALSGDGADELFAGYSKYQGELYNRYFMALPGLLKSLIVYPVLNSFPVGRGNRLQELVLKARRFVDGAANDPVARHMGWMRIASQDALSELICDYGEATAIERITVLFEQATGLRNGDSINQMLYTDLHFELPFDMLVKVDLASMQHGLEVRVPFLDHELVEFVFSLPGDMKLKGRIGKYILRSTFADLLPTGIDSRRKQGFDLPIGDWFKRELREMFHDIVFTESGDAKLWLNLSKVQGLYRDHCRGKADYTKVLWAILVFCWWLNRSMTRSAS